MNTTIRPHASHPEGKVAVPLPGCLAPDEADRAAHPDLPLPYPGDPVVLDNGTVNFLQVLDPAQAVTFDNTQLWAAGMRGRESCEGAAWQHDLIALDPEFPGLEEGDPERIRAAWELLLQTQPRPQPGPPEPTPDHSSAAAPVPYPATSASAANGLPDDGPR